MHLRYAQSAKEVRIIIRGMMGAQAMKDKRACKDDQSCISSLNSQFAIMSASSTTTPLCPFYKNQGMFQRSHPKAIIILTG